MSRLAPGSMLRRSPGAGRCSTRSPLRTFWASRLGFVGLLGFGLLAGACGRPASSAAGMARRAHELYDREQFRESHELLRQAIAQSGPAAPLLYNLGCASFRDGRLGEAIAAWESARLLWPRDPDLLHNLRLASERQVDRLPRMDRPVVERLLDSVLGNLSLDEWTGLVYGLYVLFAGALAARLLLAGSRHAEHCGTLVAVLGLLLALGLALLAGAWSMHHQPRAVITAEAVDLFSGPDASGEKVATLHSGLVVEVTGAAGQDRAIRLPTGWQGFVPASSLWPVGLDVWTTSVEPRPPEAPAL